MDASPIGKTTLLLGTVCLALVVGVAVMMRPSEADTPAPAVRIAAPPAPAAPSTPEPAQAEVRPEPAVPVIDPEMQPRTTYVVEFDHLDRLPDGYRAEGLELTAEGLQLAADAPTVRGERRGYLYAPNRRADFPLNAILPLWRMKLPDGTRIAVEFSLSPDGVNWGPWTQAIADMEGAEDISPTYPDGSPNPFYGFVPGGNFAYGEEQWVGFRYRVLLASGGPASPTLEAVRFYYQDSTLGQGTIGSVHTLEKLAGQLDPTDDFPE